MKQGRRISVGGILLLVMAALLVYYLVAAARNNGTISYAQLRQLFEQEQVTEFKVSDTRLTAKLKDGTTAVCNL